MVPISAVKLARRAWMSLAALLLLSLLAAVGLGFYGYQLHRLDSALAAYKQAAAQYQVRTEAIHRLRDMETAFNRYLLDGNSANLGLIQADKQRIEQLAQWDADAQHDQLLQSLVAAEQKWHGQIVQPIIEERRKIAAGQGLPEDFLAKYRSSGQDLQLIAFETNAENAHHQAQQALQQSQNEVRWLWLPYPLAALLVFGVVALTVGAVKRVHQLKLAAEDAGEDEEEDEHDAQEPPHEETK
jgi:hypothetical protein